MDSGISADFIREMQQDVNTMELVRGRSAGVYRSGITR